MSGSQVPPEVPEEFAEAYRRAFEQALEEGRHHVGAHQAGIDAVDRADADVRDDDEADELRDETPYGDGTDGDGTDEDGTGDDGTGDDGTGDDGTDDAWGRPAEPAVPAEPEEPAEPEVVAVAPGAGRHRSDVPPGTAPGPAPEPTPGPAAVRYRVTEYRSATTWERIRESRLFAPVLIVLVGALLVGAAYGVGRVVGGGQQDEAVPASGQPAATGKAAEEPEPDSEEQSDEPEASATPKAKKAWAGKLAKARLGALATSCTMPSGRDSAGRRVSYKAANVRDGKPRTAWRCAGDAVGEKIRIALPGGVAVGRVGLIPGYAKTDHRSSSDRYAENNRITRVRWILSDGVTVEQTLDGSPGNRSLQTMRVPRTKTGRVTLEVLEVTPGPRGTTAISEIRIDKAVG